MTTSRHAALAQAIVDYLDDTWTDKPASASIVRSYDYEHLVKDLDDDAQSVIAVITPRIGSEFACRGADHDTVTVFVCVLASLANTAAATVDAWDLVTESCRDALRSDTLKAIDIGSSRLAKCLTRPSLPTPYDADYLNGSHVFFSVIETEYQIFVEVSA